MVVASRAFLGGKRLGQLMIPERKIKTWAWRIFGFLFFGLITLQRIGSFVSWITGAPDDRPHEGQRCGPIHQWVYVRGADGDLDLSCEAD